MAKRALAVGVGGYGFPNELPNCARDAEAFGSMLEATYRFDHVRVLNDAEATREGVDRALEALVQDAGPNDRLVFYFSGHGCRFERNGAIEEALVLQDGRLLPSHQLVERLEGVPAGALTAVLDCCFSGLDDMLVHPGGEVEIARAKRWIPTDAARGERVVTHGAKAFTPFGHVKPVPVDAMAAQLHAGAPFDPSPARLVPFDEPHSKAVLVMACLADETTPAGTSKTGGLSPFTHCLLNEIRRRGPNRSAFELLQATGHELRQLGLKQTPLVKEPAQPEHLGLRAFLTFQPVLFVSPPSGPGREQEEDLTRSIAEAVRAALINFQEGRSMYGTMPGAQTMFSEPYAGFQGWQGQHGWPQRGPYEEISQIVSAVVPAILSSLQQHRFQQQPFQQQPFQQQPFQQQPFQQQPFGYQLQSPMGGLQPHEMAQIVNTVTPIVASLIQSRGYQGHFGQFMPRAA